MLLELLRELAELYTPGSNATSEIHYYFLLPNGIRLPDPLPVIAAAIRFAHAAEADVVAPDFATAAALRTA